MDDLFSPNVMRWVLLAVLAAPLAFAAVLAVGGGNPRVARRLAGLFAALHVGLTAWVVIPAAVMIAEYGAMNNGEAYKHFRPVFVPGDTGDGQEHRTAWSLFFVGKPTPNAPPPAVQFYIGLDGINVWLVALTSLMTFIAVAVSWGFAQERAGGYFAWLFVLQSAVTGAFLSFDVILFYVFFELTLIPAFFLIGGWGVGGGKRDAARKFFLYTLFGSLLSLVGLVGIVLTNPTPPGGWRNNTQSLKQDRGTLSFNVNDLMRSTVRISIEHEYAIADAGVKLEQAKPLDQSGRDSAEAELAKAKAARDGYKSTQFWLFFLLVAGFVVKVPLVPFHTWLPAAYAEAPPAVTLLLSALLAKLGTLGLLRIVIPLCPHMAVEYGLPVFGTLGAIGIVYAAFCAYAQKDVKMMAAYSSVSHLGLLALGLFALNPEGLTGAVLHMVNHGLTAGGLFAVIAILYDRYRTTDMTQLGGLMARHPALAFFTFVICLAGVGLPGLNNFVSEMMLIGALFTPWNAAAMGYGLAVAAAAGIFLSAWYTFTMLRSVFFGPVRTPALAADAPPPDLSGREVLAVGLIAALCLALGLYPQPVVDVVKGDVAVVAQTLKHARRVVNPDLADAEDRQSGMEQQPISVNPTLIPAGGRGGPPAGGPGGPPRMPQQPPR
jgi:NADH-quinone oxidoreductase subunit M